MSEIMEKSFPTGIPNIVNVSEPHMACLLLLDTSSSMCGTPIDELNAGLNRFKAEVCEDKKTKEVLDIAIMDFNSTCHIVQEFTPIEYMKPVNLSASGGTYMCPAILKAVKMVDDRSRFYRRTGTEPYKPWIIMITDGEPLDDITETVQEVQKMEESGKLKFFSLGVGTYNPAPLRRLSGAKVMKLKGYNFSSFFDWVNKSMRSISVSSPGEIPRGEPLPDDVDKDTNAWMA